MRRQRIISAASSLAAGATRRTVLAGIAGAAAGAGTWPATAEEVAGSLSVMALDSQGPTVKRVLDAYHDVRPGVKIEFSMAPSASAEYRTTILSRKLAGRLPDILQIVDRFPRQFADASITVDMRPFLHSGGPIRQDTFAPTFLRQYILDGGEHAGEIHGLPQGADAVVLYYNKKHFDDAGLAYPIDGWTWDDLVEHARKLTVTSGGQTSRYGYGCRYNWHATYVPLIAAWGGSFLKDGARVDLSQPAAINAFEMFYPHVRDGIFAPPRAMKALGDESTAFANGLMSMITVVRASLPRIKAVLKDDFDVAPWPLVNGTRKVGMGSVAMALTENGAENEAVAYDFLNWYWSEQGGMRLLASTYAVVPPVTSLFDSPVWRNLPPPPSNNDVFVEAMKHGVQNPSGIPANLQGVIDAAVENAEEAVLISGTSVKEAFAEAETTINEAFERQRG